MKKIGSIASLILLVTILVSSFAQAQERKKWSPQAKGTVIGAGAGALGGAVIHKRNRAVGGVVGGVVGGAAGYAIGKRVDNKNKEAARVAAANRAAAERRYAANRSASRRSYASSTKKASTPTKEVIVVQTPATMAYAGYAAAQPTMMYDANGNPLPQMAGYLPNPYYGDRNKPYSSYEYRRKSW